MEISEQYRHINYAGIKGMSEHECECRTTSC